MAEKTEPVGIEATLEKPFNLETTVDLMSKVVGEGHPWVIEITRYKDEKDADGNLQQETVRLTDLDFVMGDTKIVDVSSNVTSLDLIVSKDMDNEDFDDDTKVHRKHIASGMGLALVGPALDNKWFDRELKSKESRPHIDAWCEEKGIPMKNRLKSDIAEDIVEERRKEIEKLLHDISTESQKYLEDHPASKFTLRIKQEMEFMPAERVAV